MEVIVVTSKHETSLRKNCHFNGNKSSEHRQPIGSWKMIFIVLESLISLRGDLWAFIWSKWFFKCLSSLSSSGTQLHSQKSHQTISRCQNYFNLLFQPVTSRDWISRSTIHSFPQPFSSQLIFIAFLCSFYLPSAVHANNCTHNIYSTVFLPFRLSFGASILTFRVATRICREKWESHKRNVFYCRGWMAVYCSGFVCRSTWRSIDEALELLCADEALSSPETANYRSSKQTLYGVRRADDHQRRLGDS